MTAKKTVPCREDSEIIATASEVLDIESRGIEEIKNSLDSDFVELARECTKVLDEGGKIVVSGIGKSGHVGRKIAATLASTGSTAIFMHPVEAMHGDLGMLCSGDLLLTLSYSGETKELLNVILPAKRLGVKVASFSEGKKTSLAKLSDIAVTTTVSREACPFNLAPTTSSTAQLALGDALAVTLMQMRKFTKDNYGRLHPSGAIGRAVTMKVSDAMRTGDRIAMVGPDATVRDALLKMTEHRCGSAAVTDEKGVLLGIFTDGDFRRRVDDRDILARKISEVMIKKPVSVNGDALAVEVLKLIEAKKIDDIVVVDSGKRVLGLVDVQDLPGLKLM